MSLFKQYDDFLLNNASQITAVESSLRSITYFLPGRFKDAELAGEAIYASLNLLGLYHDSVLARAIDKQNPNAAASINSDTLEKRITPIGAPNDASAVTGQAPSEHARYTHHFSQHSKGYNRVARTLVIVGYFELLAEMLARRKLGKRKAWDVVAAIEALKVVLRLSLVHMTGDRMAIHPPIPQREVDPAALERERAKTMGDYAEKLDNAVASTSSLLDGSARPPKGFWKGSRTGLLRPTLASLRPGYDDVEEDPLPNPTEPDRRPPHLRAMRTNAGQSGSDTDDTLVDSTRLNASTTLNRTPANGDESLSQSRKDLPSPTINMKPWSESQINDYLLSRVLTVNDVRKPSDLVRPLRNPTGRLAEIMWILRPFIYVLALRRWGRTATLPFVLSFVLESLAKELRNRSFVPPGTSASNQNLFATNPLMAMMMGQNPLTSILASVFMGGSAADKAKKPISSVEQAEWAKRGSSFWWYLLRGPLWYSFTRPKLAGLVDRTQGKFLIGMVGGVLSDYLPLIDEYYYYSAT
ncbi:related to Peroxisomal membrane protein PEX16 [Melanopsichium pennsylvanicum]|uniref:Peroxisomal membrane protein PEX16 n=2 Tax=Melanopsichium pennsylvanicum TaxID=63383 RepID=A0AAJ4XMB1_9BASI|nr:related to Peroxisomal membrane protein PEX16 [Melanopsichium pennsylvanicum 4]SNX84546.1 related to Peroxisomal membrane protein PEX16 [Melanopsichium pennsylvanicum]